MRNAAVERKTGETHVSVELELDGKGGYEISTGVPFFNHLLELFSKQGLFDLSVSAKGDLQVDDHHTVEDVAIVLGSAFKKALGEKRGVSRYGFFEVPMDEALSRVAIDLSGRGLSVVKASFRREAIGGLSTENIPHFFQSFARSAECTLHAQIAYGENDHHKAEALFKAFGRALKAAVAIEERAPEAVASTKGLL